MPKLNFRTNAKVEQLLGRELITNNSIAIFELIKNSYDAGASLVNITFKNLNDFQNVKNNIITNKNTTIVISDDGQGMSLDDIKQKWMEIGTPAKENKNFTNNQIETITNRYLNGEKGIGRFSVDKIGAQLSMITKTINSDEIELFVNWNDFNDHSKLVEQISCDYKHNSNSNKNNGTSLRISNLRDSWTEKDIDDLISSLKKFLSPIENKSDNFKIKFNYETLSGLNESFFIKNDTFDYLDTYIEAFLTPDKKMTLNIVDDTEIVFSETFNNFKYSSFGAARVRLFYLDTNSKRFFTKRMGLRTSDYGNIKVFKDNFRVMPYGEPENDWLQIDNKHSQGVYRTFGTRDLIGYILLSHNPDHKNYILKEATDRLGFIEDTNEFKDLKRFIWTVIDSLQEYIFKKLRAKSKKSTLLLKEVTNFLDSEFIDNNKIINNVLNDYIKDDSDREKIQQIIDKNYSDITDDLQILKRTSHEIQNQIKIYDKITGKETFLFDVLHQIRNKLAVINAKLVELDFYINFKQFDFDLEHVFEAYNSIDNLVNSAIENVNLSKLKKEEIDLNQYLDSYIKINKELFQNETINIEISKSQNNSVVTISRKSLNNIFENLTSNAIKALKDSSDKKIRIELSNKGNKIQALFSDNGIGIKEEDKPFIFSLWSSFSKNNGTGIGLYSIKTTLEEINSEINLVEVNNLDYTTTFQILFSR